MSNVFGLYDRTLPNWVKPDKVEQLYGAGSKPVSSEQIEIARLRAELARVELERDIFGNATAYFA